MDILSLVRNFFYIYTLLLFGRIALSWFPNLYRYPWTKYLLAVTDPYLNVFRKIIPPIGGVLDLSPMLAIFALRFLESFVIRILR